MIVVLTFDKPHRKTQDLILQLIARGYQPLIVAREFVERQNFVPLIPHRPSKVIPVALEDFCQHLGLKLYHTHSSMLFQTLCDIPDVE